MMMNREKESERDEKNFYVLLLPPNLVIFSQAEEERFCFRLY